jgi:hypothetical protein
VVLEMVANHLKAAKSFGVQAVTNFDVFLQSGHKLQLERQIDVVVERPDKLHAEATGDIAHRVVYYDGTSVTIHDVDLNVYARIKAPDTIDAMADMLHEKFDVTPALIDLLVSDPYAVFEAGTTFSKYIGLNRVDGELCHHLLLSNAEIDYQIWVADGPEPLIRKIVIDYVDEPGVPQFTARFTEWDIGVETSSATFEFVPPEGADEIDILARNKDLVVTP